MLIINPLRRSATPLQAARAHSCQKEGASGQKHATRRVGAGFNDLREFAHLGVVQRTLAAPARAIGETVRSRLVEAMHPIAQGLPVHAANPSRFRAVHPIIDCGQTQKLANLAWIPRMMG